MSVGCLRISGRGIQSMCMVGYCRGFSRREKQVGSDMVSLSLSDSYICQVQKAYSGEICGYNTVVKLISKATHLDMALPRGKIYLDGSMRELS